jgi:hypothetical protein
MELENGLANTRGEEGIVLSGFLNRAGSDAHEAGGLGFGKAIADEIAKEPAFLSVEEDGGTAARLRGGIGVVLVRLVVVGFRGGPGGGGVGELGGHHRAMGDRPTRLGLSGVIVRGLGAERVRFGVCRMG